MNNVELQSMKDALAIDLKSFENTCAELERVSALHGGAPLKPPVTESASLLKYLTRITTILEGFEKRLSAIEAVTVNRCVVGDDRCTREVNHDGQCY